MHMRKHHKPRQHITASTSKHHPTSLTTLPPQPGTLLGLADSQPSEVCATIKKDYRGRHNMHHCLQVQEILAVVAKHLQSLYTKLDQWQPAQLQAYSKDLDSSEVFESSWPSLEDLRRQRATLVPFSLTCKYFHEVAAEIMWQTLYLEHLCLIGTRELTVVRPCPT